MMKTIAPFCAAIAMLCCALATAADEPPPPHSDPYLPPAQRIPAREQPASGAALRQQALEKLHARFNSADRNHDALLTKEEAQAGGLGFVVKHFAQIDRAQRGAVSFDDLRAYMLARRQ
jgi:hypothetical protein